MYSIFPWPWYITNDGAEPIYQFGGFLTAFALAQIWHFEMICHLYVQNILIRQGGGDMDL